MLAALASRSLGRIDDEAEIRVAELDLLRRTSIFAPLPYVALRRLTASLGESRAGSGEEIVRQGDTGISST